MERIAVRWLVGIGVVVLSLAIVSSLARTPLTEDELAKRVLASEPTWESYQEDIKAEVGSAAAAEWQGEPTRAWFEFDTVRIAFAIRGKWGERTFGVPILARDPAGTVFRSSALERRDGEPIYAIPLPKDLSKITVSWIEVRYPGGTRRLVPEQGSGAP